MNATANPVTLVVYGWRENEPGVLTWVCPDVGVAMRAARAMRNAARWLIVKGATSFDGANLSRKLAWHRARGSVLVERTI